VHEVDLPDQVLGPGQADDVPQPLGDAQRQAQVAVDGEAGVLAPTDGQGPELDLGVVAAQLVVQVTGVAKATRTGDGGGPGAIS
jgi:hypothetical protein